MLTSYTCSSAGAKTLYAWAKDAAGNVSSSRNGSVTVTLPPVSQTTGIFTAGKYGVMDMVDSKTKVYQKTLSLQLAKDYAYTITVNGTTTNGTIYSVSARCDACHSKPEGHIADKGTWGKCRSCHNSPHRIEQALNFRNDTVNNCSICHPNATHGGDSCGDCHGSSWDPLLVKAAAP